MRTRRTTIFLALFSVVTLVLAQETGKSADIAGQWQLTMETPHGQVTGPLHLQQDGAKITGSYDAEHIGTLPLTGMVQEKKVTFTLTVAGGDMRIAMSGTVEGNKMTGTSSPGDGAWTAAR